MRDLIKDALLIGTDPSSIQTYDLSVIRRVLYRCLWCPPKYPHVYATTPTHAHTQMHTQAHPIHFKNQPLPFFRRPLFAFLDRLFSPTNDRCCCLILSLRLCNLLVFLELFRVPHSWCYRILFHILGGGGTLCLTPKVGRYFYCIYCWKKHFILCWVALLTSPLCVISTLFFQYMLLPFVFHRVKSCSHLDGIAIGITLAVISDRLLFKRWAIHDLFFFIFVFSNGQLVDKTFPMSGFEPWISGVGSDCSINWATTTTHQLGFFAGNV